MGVRKVCLHCDVEFLTPNRRHETVKFCSRECKTSFGWERHNCEACGTVFSRKRSDNADSARKFCSLTCYRLTMNGRPHLRKRSPENVKACLECGSQFKVTKTRVDTAKYCSKKCQHKNADFKERSSLAQLGPKSWRWTGGKYQNKSGYIRIKKDGTFNTEHREIMFQALLIVCPNHPFIVEVDGRKRLDPEIEVHHIDRDRSNNDLSNLLAVTKQAHSQIHHRNKRPENWECWPPEPEKW